MSVSLEAFSFPIKVMKVKGNKASIKLPKGTQVEKGEIYYLNMEKENEITDSPDSGAGERSHFFGGEVDFRSLTASSGGSGSTYQIINVASYFGFNFLKFEIAPMISYQNLSIGSSQSQTWFAGFFTDYNFNENYKGVNSVWGARFQLSYGSETQASVALNVIRGQFSGVYKWFLTDTNISLGAQLGYRYESLSDSSTRSGAVFLLQVQNYFNLF